MRVRYGLGSMWFSRGTGSKKSKAEVGSPSTKRDLDVQVLRAIHMTDEWEVVL